MYISEILDKIIDELVESDITAYDFKVVTEIIEKYKKIEKGPSNRRAFIVRRNQ